MWYVVVLTLLVDWPSSFCLRCCVCFRRLLISTAFPTVYSVLCVGGIGGEGERGRVCWLWGCVRGQYGSCYFLYVGNFVRITSYMGLYVSVSMSFNCIFFLLISYVCATSRRYLIFCFSSRYVKCSLFSLLRRTHVLFLLYVAQIWSTVHCS
jgi:hypothetical protein